ncbi:aspartic-type endopeptidase like protein [Verticillium longisporum]|uniref:Aspartic-type endopeptidase like protein n=1 Tax=Verticillium longisporum TaxID=100787 RepID=A0A8I3AGE8_VERLO|nr:aspartic-type endopeptidase like protein [Verticillium longisporum]
MKPISLLTSLAGAGLLTATLVHAEIDLSSPFQGVSFQRIKAVRDRSSDETSTHRQVLKPFHGRITGHNAASAIAAAEQGQPGAGYQNITALSPYGTQYAMEVIWDGTPIQMIFDTGSSDTWAARSDFSCTNRGGTIEYPQESCSFGNPAIDNFKYGEIPDIHFTLGYGSGERVSGPMGYSDLTVAGITVKQTQVGLANQTFWYGNNVTQGILGMAYPALTSAYSGSLSENRQAFQIPYAPFFTTMVQQGLSDASFSVALARNSSNGLIAWGGRTGLPTTGPTASTDLIVANINPTRSETAWKYSYYTIIVEGVQWGQTVDSTHCAYIVDTATTLTYVPPQVAEAIANAFEPAAMYMFSYGGYFAPCDAIAPRIAFHIGGEKFFINPVDMMWRHLKDPLTGYCQIGISTGGSGPYILGMTFLQNVEVEFDVGAAEVRFHGRQFYGPTPALPEQ